MGIWRLADDRWPQARPRLDFDHAVQHLAAVGRALWGEDNAQFKARLKTLVRRLKNESAVNVIRQLEEAVAGGRTDRERGGGSDRSAGAVPVQAARPVLEHGGRRSAALPGNLLAQ
ncbi:MAG: hypothetical protein IPM17_02720 [Verrucomicrobia bacterium]|nr:hypothetical protein [Verrucomicrobiota bacterium]